MKIYLLAKNSRNRLKPTSIFAPLVLLLHFKKEFLLHVNHLFRSRPFYFVTFQLEAGSNKGRGQFDPEKNKHEIIQPKPIEVMNIYLYLAHKREIPPPNGKVTNKKRYVGISLRKAE